jgi:hypothetical protein
MAGFRVCFEAHRADGKVWAVQVGRGKWRFTHQVVLLGEVSTKYYGRGAKQPKAVITGEGLVEYHPSLTHILSR